MQWNAGLYDSNHQFVSEYGNGVIQLLVPGAREQILDLGCGTGGLAAECSKSGAEVTGMDASAEMIEKAKEKYPGLSFVCSDAVNFELNTRFDAVFSNAVLHWIPEAAHPKMLKQVKKYLKPGGRFVAEMGAVGNVEKVRSTIRELLKEKGYLRQAQTETWYFPSEEAYGRMLEGAGFTISHIEVFDRPTILAEGDKGIARWLEMFGKNWFTGLSTTEINQLVREAEEKLYPRLFENGNWIADYRRLRFCAEKREKK